MIEQPATGTGLLVVDIQNDIIERVCGGEAEAFLAKVARAIAVARTAGAAIIYVVAAFRPGHPELNARNKRLSAVRAAGRLIEGSAGAAIPEEVAPSEMDVVITKRRVGAFAHTELRALLSSLSITQLAHCGVATGGAVLSTVLQAADEDFESLVLEDCVMDTDPSVHQILVERLFPLTANVDTIDGLGAWIRSRR